MTIRTLTAVLVVVTLSISVPGTSWGARPDRPPGQKRPKAFNPHWSFLFSGHGWAVQGCLPGCADGAKPGALPGMCGDGRVDTLSISAHALEHPPLTKEEHSELKALEGKCSCKVTRRIDWAHRTRHTYLYGKHNAFGQRRRAQLAMQLGLAHYIATRFTLTCLAEGADGATQVTVTQDDFVAKLPRPWHFKLKVLSFEASFALNSQQNLKAPHPTTVDVKGTFVPYQNRWSYFGSLATNLPAGPRFVLMNADPGRKGLPPPWHCWTKPGKEEDGDWDDDEPASKPDDKGGSKGNNGVGNGIDPAPKGNPKENDGAGTSPGNPGNKGGGK